MGDPSVLNVPQQNRIICNDFGHFVGNTPRQMETSQQTETVVQCGPFTRQVEAGPSVITTRIGDIIMQSVSVVVMVVEVELAWDDQVL